eukprot:COSAG01_NODE_98_length_26629_cov_56.866453_23_plen_124_part_00
MAFTCCRMQDRRADVTGVMSSLYAHIKAPNEVIVKHLRSAGKRCLEKECQLALTEQQRYTALGYLFEVSRISHFLPPQNFILFYAFPCKHLRIHAHVNPPGLAAPSSAASSPPDRCTTRKRRP